MKKFAIFLLAASIAVSGCATVLLPKEEYPIAVYAGSSLMAACKSIDAEKRIAYNCVFSGVGEAKEIHLSVNNSWAKR